jgi:hypothetical protein
MRRLTILASLVAVGAASLGVAGCGGSSSPRVASVAAATTTATTATPPGGSGNGGFQGSSGAPSGNQVRVALRTGSAAQGAKFSACMRKHGLQNFPDPDAQGVITFGSSSGIDPNSPTFVNARIACGKFLPNGGRPSPQVQAQQQQKLLAFAQCMRAHGIKDFPDPSKGTLSIQFKAGSDLSPNNPQFLRAQAACPGGGFFGGGAPPRTG